MVAPTFKKATDTAPGDATKYGAPDIKYLVDVLDGAHATDRVQVANIEGAVATNDSRLSDARTPTAHKTSHESGGSDAIATLGDITLAKSMALSGDLTPSQITSNQNDYNPTNLATASVLRLSTDARRTITGLAGGADGRILILQNVGSFVIRLTAEDSSSSAGNRFAFGIEQWLYPNDSLVLCYDSTSSRWRANRDTNTVVMVKPADETVNNSNVMQNDDDFAFAAVANAIYIVEMSIDVAIEAASDFQYRFTVPAGATFRASGTNAFAVWVNAGAISEADLTNTRTHLVSAQALVVWSPQGAMLRMAGTAGTIQFQWSQNTAVAENTIVKKGSIMKVTRVI